MPARVPGARLATTFVPAAAAACAIAAVVAVPRGDAPLRTYAGTSTTAHALDLVAGLALVVAGSVAWSQSRLRRIGVLAILAGAAWFVPDWEGWDGGPTLARSIAAAARDGAAQQASVRVV